MSELMRCLYDYLSARRVLDFFPSPGKPPVRPFGKPGRPHC